MSYDQFMMFCFANSINPEYKFIQKYKDGTIKLFKKRDVDPGIVLDTSFFNPVIFECIPINKIYSIYHERRYASNFSKSHKKT